MEDFDAYFVNAIQSIVNNSVLPETVIVVAPVKTINHITTLMVTMAANMEGYQELNLLTVVNTGETDFASQMNYAATQVKTDYMSLLEVDDEYSDLWFRNVEKYQAQYPEISMFLPIISDVNHEQKFLGYSNEIAWAFEFTDKHGIVDAESLKAYPNFNPDGMVMRVADFIEIGGYKKNIKLSFNLEFLLRACEQARQIMVIPKIGYKHVNMRPESLFWNYKNGDNKLTLEESEFWMETAAKEYYYADDRAIEFVPPTETDDTEVK